ncbi:MAG TPA: Gfo/Idh/MocA family oxidoreductase [Baekduia sp.]|uniref:Gfo/Idh/MocA family protein n=1 Tax=Baekduia sp. TaxID=2600305 RepID=UPI002D772AE9|nr:Gfo/Idh/MocA family oxidoreductase [Baekduia sp.]HET6507848.1 Gfo/Idh/MocA family oxidoreductase [Baekduia sp.]
MTTQQTLRVGIVGCGNIGSGSHLPGWQANRDVAAVVGLADPSPETLDRARALAGLASTQAHLDPMELIARPDVDAIDICTPQHLRRDLIAAAAAHGKHVLCEKPLGTIPSDAAAAVAAGDITLAMVHNYLWLPEVRAAQRVIDSGEIGAVRSVTVNFLGIVDVPGSAGYAPRWRHEAALAGGGVLMDILHGVYVAESLLGEPLRRVSAYADNRDPDANVEDLALCRFETGSNAALVNIAWGHGPGGLEVTGTEGRVVAVYRDGGTSPWSPLDRVLVTTAAGTRVELDVTGQADDDYAALLDTFVYVTRDFTQAALGGTAPRASGADGLRILEATVGALASAATGRIVEIPLDRDSPAFLRGVLGVADLDLPDWSPVRTRGLYRQTTTTAEETSR